MHYNLDIIYANLESTLKATEESKIPILLEFDLSLEENPALVTTTTGWISPPLKHHRIAAALQTFESDDKVKSSLIKELGSMNVQSKYCNKYKLSKRGLSDAIEFSRKLFNDHMTILCDTDFDWESFALKNVTTLTVIDQFKNKIKRHNEASDPYQLRFFECDVVTVKGLGNGLYVAKEGWLGNVSLGRYSDFWVGLVKTAKHLIIPVVY